MKQFLPDDLYSYIVDNSVYENKILAEIRAASQNATYTHMLITQQQAQFLQFIVSILQPKKALEIGVLTGYSLIAIAQKMPKDSIIHGIELRPEYTSTGTPIWQKSGVFDKIKITHGDAANILPELIKEEAETYDFIFIDACKRSYNEYYEWSLTLLKSGGVMILDNTLLQGQVVTHLERERVQIINKLNAKLKEDKRVEISLLPLGDGMTLIRKL